MKDITKNNYAFSETRVIHIKASVKEVVPMHALSEKFSIYIS